MKIEIDLDDPSSLPNKLKMIAEVCIEQATKIDPEKKTLKGAMYRVINLHVNDYGNKLDKRLNTLIKEYSNV